MPPPIIAQIRTLQRFGIFTDYHHTAEVPGCKRYNLIYGFNGAGKTTLSRLFRSLDLGDPAAAVPVGGRFEFELTDGRAIRVDEQQDALAGRVLVFNVDFINDNLRWTDGRANPVFYIGKEASRRAELLGRVERRIPLRDEQRRSARSDRAAKDRALSIFCTDTARIIAEMLGLGRQYDARHLKQDYESGPAGSYQLLSEEEREDRRKLIRQSGAYDRLVSPAFDVQSLEATLDRARRCAETTISGLSLQEMQDHPAVIPWLKTGYSYHREHSLETCLFCGNEIPEARFAALQSALDERIDRFFDEIEEAGGDLRKMLHAIGTLTSAMPSERDISASLSRDYAEEFSQFQRCAAAAREMVSQADAALTDKACLPNQSNWPAALSAEAIAHSLQALRQRHEQLAELIERHNVEQNEFAERQERARNELKFAVLIERSEQHDTLRADLAAADAAQGVRERIYDKATGFIATLRNEVRDHGPAAPRINALLRAYLGHSEIQLEVFEEGYRILRHEAVLTGSLSEGERTAIALCYFLSKLEEDGRDISEQIIVIDDPVSSLDAGALNYAFNLLKGRLQGAQQLFVLTHNLAFMNEVKKWLRTPREKGQASFFFIRTWQADSHNRRQAVIEEMPKLLRGYDSEYQYLFYLVNKCSTDGMTSPEIPGYIMPNVIRRVLELFLAFKVPGSEGLGDKINRPLVQNAGLEEGRLQALNRLTQVESHSDSLDDFIGFSSMTMEETHHAAQTVLRLIDFLDNDHYARMCELAQ
jgi:wobble nucleotide-excising tRNase